MLKVEIEGTTSQVAMKDMLEYLIEMTGPVQSNEMQRAVLSIPQEIEVFFHMTPDGVLLSEYGAVE